jgi:hypothetical protein
MSINSDLSSLIVDIPHSLFVEPGESIKENNFDVSLLGITYMTKVTLSMAMANSTASVLAMILARTAGETYRGAYPVIC